LGWGSSDLEKEKKKEVKSWRGGGSTAGTCSHHKNIKVDGMVDALVVKGIEGQATTRYEGGEKCMRCARKD